MIRVCVGIATITLCEGTAPPATPAPAPAEPAGAPPGSFDTSWQALNASACMGSQIDYQKCEQQECGECEPVDCELGAWSDWSSGDCTGLCERARSFVQHNNKCGDPCNNSLVETKNGDECHTCRTPMKEDCEWDDWSDWSACTCKCGGGQMTRDRRIKQSPSGGGRLCPPENRTEITECNTQQCGPDCRNGEWGDWDDWGVCTHSCGGGTQMRSRIVARQPNACGTPVVGASSQYRPCNTEISCEEAVDCKWDDWSDWSDCSCTCDGVKRRSRTIQQYGSGPGEFCEGPTKEIAQCNPDVRGEIPDGCGGEPPVDCELDNWSDWGECSTTCGGGQKVRSRKVRSEAKAGGRPCGGEEGGTYVTLSETTECKTESCTQGVEAQDCTWGDWKDWGECDKCGGEKRRYRLITAMPKNGGQPCDDSLPLEQVTGCNRTCNADAAPVYCVWGDWGPYTACSATCGNGYRNRTRLLESRIGEQPSASRLYDDLIKQKQQMENENVQEMVLAFACGAVSFVVFLSAARAIRSSNLVRRTRDLGME